MDGCHSSTRGGANIYLEKGQGCVCKGGKVEWVKGTNMMAAFQGLNNVVKKAAKDFGITTSVSTIPGAVEVVASTSLLFFGATADPRIEISSACRYMLGGLFSFLLTTTHPHHHLPHYFSSLASVPQVSRLHFA